MVRPAVGQCIPVLTSMCLPRQNNQECVDLGLEVHLHLTPTLSPTLGPPLPGVDTILIVICHVALMSMVNLSLWAPLSRLMQEHVLICGVYGPATPIVYGPPLPLITHFWESLILSQCCFRPGILNRSWYCTFQLS